MQKEYKGFEVISEHQIPDCASQGIYLRHKKTGLEVFHLLNDDQENLFAFAFRTPVKDSTGAAHITEHSVFCGSEKFPLKEPFTNMMNQSVNTFLNALTYFDKTVYPASSMIKSDYFNLMDVYGDAVFFPLLKKEAFLQEAHRVEIDEKGKYSIQGVVYNEMKGNYSSFESVATDIQFSSLLPETNYAYDSGGDPAVIPEFTYEQFKAFHKKYYRPDNCLVFLYGNIPTEEQLDFLQEHFLDRLENKFAVPEAHSIYPFVPEEFVQIETPKVYTKPRFVEKIAPDSGATGATVTINWLCGQTRDLQSYMEACFLSEVLTGHDGSPLTKVLIESNLGDDLAPLTGCSNETRSFSISFGLHGVKPCNKKKVYKLIEQTLQNLAEKGIDKRDVESALMSAELSNREVVRSGGPFSLTLLERALNGWNYGRKPAEMLYFRAALEEVRKNLKADPNYVEKLIHKFLLDNHSKTYVSVVPSRKFLKERNKNEKKLVSQLKKSVSEKSIKDDLDLMHAYQEHHETVEETSCIPTLELSDLPEDIDEIKTEIKTIKVDDEQIPVFTNTENTNGIVYLELCLAADTLKAEEYPYLPLYSYCVSNLGWNGKDWSECASLTALKTGGITCRLVTSQTVDTPESRKCMNSLSKFNCTNRDWVIFFLRSLSETLDEGADLFGECVSTYDFKDTKHLKTLIAEANSAIKSGILPRGNRYAAKRVQAYKNHTCAVDEIWRGITQLFALNNISKMNVQSLADRFEGYVSKLFDGGAVFHITTDAETMPKALEKVEKLAKNLKLKALKPKIPQNEEDFNKLLLLGEEKELPSVETFTASSQVGYASSCYEGTIFGQKENSKDLIFAHWLSCATLWEKIRTKGGAYGAYASSANMPGLFTLATFRDPNPWRSVQVFDETLQEGQNTPLDKEELKRLITGTYGDEVQPNSPFSRGNIGFNRTLSCVSHSDRVEKIKNILNATQEEIKEASSRLYASAGTKRTVVICDKSQKNTGVIIELPL